MMETQIERSTAIRMLEMLMRRRGLTLSTASSNKIRLYAVEKIVALAQILVNEGKWNFVGECEVSGLHVIADSDGGTR